jgi:hypothetical protein
MLVTTIRGSIEFDGTSVTIRPPKGLMGLFGGKTAMSVPLRAIRYIEFSEPSGPRNGYFRINTGQPPLVGTVMRPAFLDAAKDPHSIVFIRREASSFIELKNTIESALNG